MADPPPLPRIILFATGGTISMRRETLRGGAVPALSGTEILAAVPGWDEVARVEVREFGRLPGPHITIERMWALRAAILDARREGAEGIVVTHGTDTIEETVYLLDRSLDPAMPVVVTGAMRNSSELSWDGPANLMAALRVAAASESRGRGAMVVMDERVVQGAEVVKTHTEELQKSGASIEKINDVVEWRSSNAYTERERAALSWTEVVTNIQDGHAPEAVYRELRTAFTELEVVNLTLISTINAWNRMAIALGRQAEIEVQD